jgi:8-oxo-dGTP pyrophosphatase MutT (NUDIX family)
MTADAAARLRAFLARRERQRLEGTDAVASAVLVPLFAGPDGAQVLFTRRTDTLPHHGGQIAFPGGRHHADTDASLLETALREAEEEVGLSPAEVVVVGPLDDIHTVSTNFVITPFLATIPHPYDFRPDPREVAEVFSVPLRRLRDRAAWLEETWELHGHRVPIMTLHHEGRVIWGATQRITWNLLELLAAFEREVGPL